MKLLQVSIGIIIYFFITRYAYAEEEVNVQQKTHSNVLIIYLSRTQNTQVVAEIIHQYIGGDLASIELEKPYPSDYLTMVQQVHQENNQEYLPLLKKNIVSIESYDVVFIGFPTWDMQMPPPIKAFLNETNLSGKVVVPFHTHAGYGVGSGFVQLEQRCSGCILLQGIEIKGGKERDGILLALKGKEKQLAKAKILHWLQQLANQNKAIHDLLP